MPILSLLAVALGALAVKPASVPAKGSQQSIITVDRTSMVHLSTSNPSGTACEVVDHLRGPFARSGEAGSSNCDLDLLLEAGIYKVRLSSPPKGKGNVTLKAEPFEEVNAQALRLEPGRQVDLSLKPRQQASFWIHLERRTFVPLQIAGRAAGKIVLWKSGEWSESVDARPATVTPAPGKPIHEWWIGQYLESGDHLLTVYGTDPEAWTKGPEENSLSVRYLFEPLPPGNVVDAVIPASGTILWSAPKSPTVAWLELPTPSDTPTNLELRSTGDDGARIDSVVQACRIETKATRRRCVVRGSDDRAWSLVARGAPGTRIHLEAGRLTSGSQMLDGDYTWSDDVVAFRAAQPGPYLVALQDLAADSDAAPLSCVLRRYRPNAPLETIARDFLRVPARSILERSFNYEGGDLAVWLDIAAGGTYAISTSGQRKSFCELYQLSDAGERTRVTETTTEPGCKIEKTLSPGAYELKLYKGDSGIESLKIADVGKSLLSSNNERTKASAEKTTCLFPLVTLEEGASYRIETSRGSGSARGLTLRPRPLALTSPLTLELAPGRSLELPLAGGGAVTVAADGGIACTWGRTPIEAKGGICKLQETAGAETLTLASRAASPIQVRLFRSVPPPQLAPLQVYNPAIEPLPSLSLDKPVSFDFDRQEDHSLVFDIKDAGLYHLTTTGLLSTRCQIRTASAPRLAQDERGGRGRNCLVASYLRPGRYLATVATTERSRGRAGIVLSRRPSIAGPDTTTDSTVFFKAAADTLIDEKLLVGAGGKATLETLARGASLSCRLEDKDGWPVEPVPTACSLTRDFAPGQYRWVQMPLTVESMRRTRLEKVRPPVVLTGAKPHEVGFNTWYQAKLNPSGKDELLFEVPAELEVQLVLTDGMQGRLYRVNTTGEPTPVELIAPQSQGPSESGGQEDEASQPSDEQPPEDAQPYPEGVGDGEEAEGASPDESEAPAPRPDEPPARPPARSLNQPEGGQALSLAAGKYKLIAEHSRQDVAVSYRLYLRSDVLAPGIARDAGAPGILTVRVPREGILRLRSSGESDVRCRLFDSSGRLVVESDSIGDDWNCAFAEPLPAGDYRLSVESETLAPVSTHVGVVMPPLESAPVLAEGQTLKIDGQVVVAAVPEAQGDVVQEVRLVSSGAAFSCDASGKGGVIARRSQVKDCSFLLHSGGDPLTVRAWLVERLPAGPVPVTVHVVSKPIKPGRSSVSGSSAASAAIPRDGRYATSAGVLCLPEATRGALEPCGPEVSLEKGTVIFAALGSGDVALPLDEIPFKASGKATTEKLKLDAQPFIQTSRSSGDAVHLLAVVGLSGESSAPTCAVASGVRAIGDTQCFAASSLVEEAVERIWIAGVPGDVEMRRRAIAKPKDSEKLAVGPQSLTWPEQSALMLVPPSDPGRVELTLPPQTWAVQLDAGGKAADLCPPEKSLARCVFSTRGGEILVWGEGERRVEATVLLGESPARARLTAGLFEATPTAPGFLSIDLPAAPKARRLEVEGARHCSVRLADGSRLSGCSATLPQGQAGELLVAHDARPVRASARDPENGLDALFPMPGSAPQEGPPLAMGQSVPLVGAGQVRTIKLDAPAVVHVRGDSGVCGLARGGHLVAADGLGTGCELHRLLEAGTWTLLVRPFGAQPLTGALSWTPSGLKDLSEGVGPEGWLTGGQASLFRFTLASAGRVGIGLQEPAETLSCTVRDTAQSILGDGCQQLLKLEAGSYLLEVRSPESARPTWFRPVVVGLQGAKMEVPEEYLRDLFKRIGATP